MLNRIYRLNSNIGKSLGTMFRQYGRNDLGILNNVIRHFIFICFTLNIVMIIFCAYLGFERANAFGPVTISTGIGYTSTGLALEIFMTFFLTVFTINIIREKIHRKINGYK